MAHEVASAAAMWCQHQSDTFERADLTGQDTIGRTELMGLLGGDRDQLRVQQRVELLTIGGRVDIGKKYVVRAQISVFRRQDLLHLYDQFCLIEHFRATVDKLGPRRCILVTASL